MTFRLLLTLALFATCSALASGNIPKAKAPLAIEDSIIMPATSASAKSTAPVAQDKTPFYASSSSEETMCVFSSSSVAPICTYSSSENVAESSSANLVKDSTTLVTSSSTKAPQSSSSVAKSDKNPYNLPDELMSLWNSMSMRQKAGQMIMVFLTSSQFVIENELGGILITGKHLRNIDSYKERMTDIDSNLKIPLFTALDQEGGLVNRLVSYSKQWDNLPSAREMRHMDSTQIHTLAKKIGSTLKNIRINMNLAPVLDPSKDHRGSNSFMEESRRSWGNDTSNAYKVRAFVNGMRDNGIAGRPDRGNRRRRYKNCRTGLDIVPVADPVDILDHGRICAEIDTETVADARDSISALHLIFDQIIADGISHSDISRSGST